VTILDVRNSTQKLPKIECGFDYRTSGFKQGRRDIILTAEFELKQSEAKACITRMNSFTEHRRRTQPTDPSIGSMFRNPTGDFAGRLIEQAGLKGKRVGNVEVSSIHANFFVNLGMATARDVMNLIQVVRDTVHETFGIDLQLEIEVVGE
jgi:UDP-N-acetylmuramate dehydrogenase